MLLLPSACGAMRESGDRVSRPSLRFVDLFAGVGGFHLGLSDLGHHCVFASELDPELRRIYERNFELTPHGDIRQISAIDVPAHDVLCAGFPCQPFSLAGKKAGTTCPSSGKLIDDVFRIVEHHKPNYIFLENVPNILTIADGSFWRHIQNKLSSFGYSVKFKIYSPLQFGFPQQRYRLFVVASRIGLGAFDWPDPKIPVTPLTTFILDDPEDVRHIEPAKLSVLEMWNGLLPELNEFSSLTLMASEFGATYPLDGLPKSWGKFRGAFGASLDDFADRREAIAALPHYAAMGEGGAPPTWMRPSIEYSRRIYRSNPEFFDQWKLSLISLPNSWQKFEWRGNREVKDIWLHTIQFRASGIRIMRPELAPSLVAMTPTQTPIVGAKQRYMSIREAAALQALERLNTFPASVPRAFKALGNAVNAHIVREIASRLLG